MQNVVAIMVGVIALLHVYFMILEMFLWTKPLGLRSFKQSREQAAASAVLAGNQGLYNGFLAAGLMWSLLHPLADVARQLQIFFLGCVFVAGLYGWRTVKKNTILFFQALPAAVAIALLLFSQRP